jgi:CRISPR-associated protein Cas5t
MIYLVIPLHSRTASFRDPEFQNFHRTLRLPPPATCIGLAGAALGLAAPDAQDFFTEHEWQIGIAGTSNGQANDLWKYDNFEDGSILIREYLYDNRFVLVFGHADAARIDRLAAAFTRPHYALSCGNSDSICTVDILGMYRTEQCDEARELVHCYTEGDIIAKVLSAVNPETATSFSIRTTSLPVAQDLPVRFTYDKKGIRMLRQRRLISYVQYPTKLPEPISGIKFLPHADSPSASPLFVPLFPL